MGWRGKRCMHNINLQAAIIGSFFCAHIKAVNCEARGAAPIKEERSDKSRGAQSINAAAE